MAATSTLVPEKLEQAVAILRELEIDLWLTFVRETMLTSDPCLDLIAGTYSAWTGAFIVSATGEVMPCTTTDLAESAGNVRERAFSRIWADGFGRFRSGAVDGRECWLQARNGHAVREHAFADAGGER